MALKTTSLWVTVTNYLFMKLLRVSYFLGIFVLWGYIVSVLNYAINQGTSG